MTLPADFKQIRTIKLNTRTNLVKASEFASVPARNSSFAEFLEILPTVKHRTNAAGILGILVRRMLEARRKNRPITWAIGPHIIKYGLAPLIIELMDMGFVQCILMNGAGAIHDTEIALIGETSEEMSGQIATGTFGMAHETGEFIHQAARRSARDTIGFGAAIGDKILAEDLPWKDVSLLAQARRRNIPFTLHVAIGTDIIHMHPGMDGAATGAATFIDFRIFTAILQDFSNGGVHLNIGSTVILPEVFVKAMTAANNLNGSPTTNFTTFNIDHLSEYRPLMNVVQRSTIDGGDGYEIIGRMELLVPLIFRILQDSIQD